MGSFKFSTVVCKGALGIDEGYLGQSVASSPILNRAAATVLPRVHGACGEGGGHRHGTEYKPLLQQNYSSKMKYMYKLDYNLSKLHLYYSFYMTSTLECWGWSL